MTAPGARPAARASETFTCCETAMPWPAGTEDRTCPECGTTWEHDGVRLGAGARIKPQTGPAPLPPLGPFETSREAIAAGLAASGHDADPLEALSATANRRLLGRALEAAGVEVRRWDDAVAEWLAGLDVQTVAAVAGWVQRARQPAADTRRLDAIRGVLARFDWERDDRQLALEAIERIAEGAAR